MGRNQFFVGFVIHSGGNGAFYAWCKKLKDDIVIDHRFCPPNTNILSRWVEIELDDRFRVCGPVRIINDLFESIHDGKFAEVKVQIKPEYCYHGIEMFTNDEMGLIGDPRHVIGRVEIDGVYDVWIRSSEKTKMYHETGARWVVSTRNMNVAPMNRRNELPSSSYNIDSQADRSHYSRRRSPENYGYNRPPSRSPQRAPQRFDNGYGNDNYRRRDDWNRNFYDYQSASNSVHGSDGRRSPGPRNYYQNDNNFPRNHPPDNEINRPYRASPSVRNEPAFDRNPPSNNSYPSNERRTRTPERNIQSQSSYRHSPAPPPVNHLTSNAPQESAQLYKPRGSSMSSSQYNRPRTRCDSSRSRGETTSDSDDDEPPKITGPIQSARERGENIRRESDGVPSKSPIQNNEPTSKHVSGNQAVVETRQGQRSSDVSVLNSQATLDKSRDQVKQPVYKVQKTAEEKEMTKLKTKVTLMKNLIRSLTSSKEVRDKMMLASLEEYEELMSIVKQ
ncbi:hypothetical protein GCK72_014252 [Caenorhabditis remanei]|uniref:Uncharacterized protein n=1 Tax=Caenorhabditis remanei TaxID=31234 RepID=A0A6A5GTJ0_CAERE|nr:hypothetical protein GCK72_014252 [Caenorhabditis remanei]KAF1757795.1 hypothetical protein GCK72_014252 [Caenorhabditis remanei]